MYSRGLTYEIKARDEDNHSMSRNGHIWYNIVRNKGNSINKVEL